MTFRHSIKRKRGGRIIYVRAHARGMMYFNAMKILRTWKGEKNGICLYGRMVDIDLRVMTRQIRVITFLKKGKEIKWVSLYCGIICGFQIK